MIETMNLFLALITLGELILIYVIMKNRGINSILTDCLSDFLITYKDLSYFPLRKHYNIRNGACI